MLYQIKDWDQHYENNKSRERPRLSWCAIPNKQDGLGYKRLLAMKDGEAAYGCFVATVLAASKARTRNGWLTDDGSQNGVPWDAKAISLKTGFSVKTASNMLQYCTMREIGWIGSRPTGTKVPAECPPSARQVPAECPPSALEGKEGKEGREGKEWNDSSDRLPTTESEPPHRRVAFDYTSGQFTGLTDGDYAVWADAYPAVDHKAEVQKARAWLLANPNKRKKNVYGFLTRWMASQQERAGRRGQYASARDEANRRADARATF